MMGAAGHGSTMLCGMHQSRGISAGHNIAQCEVWPIQLGDWQDTWAPLAPLRTVSRQPQTALTPSMLAILARKTDSLCCSSAASSGVVVGMAWASSSSHVRWVSSGGPKAGAGPATGPGKTAAPPKAAPAAAAPLPSASSCNAGCTVACEMAARTGPASAAGAVTAIVVAG